MRDLNLLTKILKRDYSEVGNEVGLKEVVYKIRDELLFTCNLVDFCQIIGERSHSSRLPVSPASINDSDSIFLEQAKDSFRINRVVNRSLCSERQLMSSLQYLVEWPHSSSEQSVSTHRFKAIKDFFITNSYKHSSSGDYFIFPG